MTSLLERLARAERSALQQVDELRTRLAEAGEQVRRLSITRETLLLLDDHDGEDAGEQPGLDPHDSEDATSPLPVLRGWREQAVALLTTAERPMRAREIVQALGKPDTRSQVEGMRSRLQRLVTDGWLRREADGLYAIAAGSTATHRPGRPIDHPSLITAMPCMSRCRRGCVSAAPKVA
ncbi:MULTISPECIES: hypothetical protein [unclassified Nonomuraea]|uniref:hypothetical protein n=1 Tax=unclassified Nonomuraea TaxID=2593643 RepID=UPI0010FD2780|nr:MULTISPECIES: hypothetical protein [unclassified Nonomuraea]NBE99775.1 hypothetical protein [Nonomuraea sp. K271]